MTTKKRTIPPVTEMEVTSNKPFLLNKPTGHDSMSADTKVHVYQKKRFVCETNSRGRATPNGRSPVELVLHAPQGVIPLWAEGTILNWRFNAASFEQAFVNPDAAKIEVRKMLSEAIFAWGDAAPVKFAEDEGVPDFEITVRSADNCSATGCVLASAFFPDGGRHEVFLYPQMFTQSQKERIDTLIHEIGHVFGLRHFFAQELESGFPSERFGTHSKFSIMNYGNESELTDKDRSDLKTLYAMAWKGELKNINGTPIRFVRPFHSITGPNAFQLGGGATAEARQPPAAQMGVVLDSTQKLLKVAADLLLASSKPTTAG